MSASSFDKAASIPAEFIAEGAETPVLGPAYFAARASAQACMANFEAEFFRPLIDKFAGEFVDALWAKVSDHLIGDTEQNIQSEMWRTIDGTVNALLAGERWAIARYALGERYDHEKVRATIAKHVPAELQDARIADLEAKVKELTEQLERERRYRS